MSRFLLLILLLASPVQAGWKAHVSQDDSDSMPDRAAIAYAAAPQFGRPTLQDAITELEDSGHIEYLEVVILYGGSVDPTFQDEIIEKLKEYAPKEFEIATNSGGGTYDNPELESLHRVFDEVVLHTETVTSIDEQLAAVGKRVSGASHEKLRFRETEERLVIHFFLYLDVENI